jgi:hypothetical protein
MAKITETELRRKLNKLEKNIGGSSGSSTTVGAAPPAGPNEGDTYFDPDTGILYIFYNGDWIPSSQTLHIRYAELVINLNNQGKVTSNDYVTGFSENPYTPTGTLNAWRGTYIGNPIAPNSPTYYTWRLTQGEDGEDGKDSILVAIETSNGTVFKNDLGSTILTANVYIGGIEVSESDYNTFTYEWTVGLLGKVCRYNINNEVSSVASDGICPSGETLAIARTIVVGAEDVDTTAKFKCTVGNIAD